MEWLTQLADLFLHLDRHLADIIGRYGVGTYAILVLIIFCETGLVVTPFLPGDSLLFAAGSLAALGAGLDPMVLFLLLSAAAIAGDTVNYWIGSLLGKGVAEGRHRLIRRDYLERTHRFYERHGWLDDGTRFGLEIGGTVVPEARHVRQLDSSAPL